MSQGDSCAATYIQQVSGMTFSVRLSARWLAKFPCLYYYIIEEYLLTTKNVSDRISLSKFRLPND